MATRFVFEGLDQLRAELRALPAELAGEASHIIQGEGNAAVVALKTEYGTHRVSGKLQDGVDVTFTKGRASSGAVVKSGARHAWLFDNGSQARHWASGKSTGTMWGRTPPTHVFVRTMIAARRRMYGGLRDLLTRNGLSVTGES